MIYLVDPSHRFFSEYSLKNLVHDSALYGVLALGAAVVIISGGIDLSVGAVVALSGVVCVKMLGTWEPYLARQSPTTLTLHPLAAEGEHGRAGRLRRRGDRRDAAAGTGRRAAARAR